jgi:hypothetical protein
LQEKRYYKGLVLDQLKSPKVVAPSGAEGAKGKQKLSVAEQMRLAAKNKKAK